MRRWRALVRICFSTHRPEPALRALIRPAGEGLEYDLDDVALLRFILYTARRLSRCLICKYRRCGGFRARHGGQRTVSAFCLKQFGMNPGRFRGYELHASQFDPLQACLEEELHHLLPRPGEFSGEVLADFLRIVRNGGRSLQRLEPVYRAALRKRVPARDAVQQQIVQQLRERERRPGINVWGYFHSDIGIGEFTRGLAKMLGTLRPINPVPVCTGQLRDETPLSELFQRFDYLSDTNVFVTYPHMSEDILGTIRPEYLSGRENIAHLAWEQQDASLWWKPVYDRCDEIWVLAFLAAVPFRTVFPNRVRVVPNVLDFDRFPDCHELADQRLGGDILRFLFVFDANSSME